MEAIRCDGMYPTSPTRSGRKGDDRELASQLGALRSESNDPIDRIK
jgi:hypothetical protein